MKTDDLVGLLATGAGRVERHAAPRRYAAAIAVGIVAAAVLMLSQVGGHPDLADAMRLPMFWAKVVYVGSLAVLRLSLPGAHLDRVLIALAVPVVAMWALAAYVLANAAPGERMGLVLGATWGVCPFLIAMLSVPMFAATRWVMRSLAPTRLPLAGAAAGLLSGTLGGLVYCLACTARKWRRRSSAPGT